MADHDQRIAFGPFQQRFEHAAFGHVIERGSRLVEQPQPAAFEQRAGDSQPLLFAVGQIFAFFQYGIFGAFVRQVDLRQHAPQFVVADRFVRKQQVVANRAAEKVARLKHDVGFAPEVFRVQLAERHAAERNPAFRRRMQLEDQLQNARLARTARADDRRLRAGFEAERNAAQHGTPVFGVPEPDAVQLDGDSRAALMRSRRNGARRPFRARFANRIRFAARVRICFANRIRFRRAVRFPVRERLAQPAGGEGAVPLVRGQRRHGGRFVEHGHRRHDEHGEEHAGHLAVRDQERAEHQHAPGDEERDESVQRLSAQQMQRVRLLGFGQFAGSGEQILFALLEPAVHFEVDEAAEQLGRFRRQVGAPAAYPAVRAMLPDPDERRNGESREQHAEHEQQRDPDREERREQHRREKDRYDDDRRIRDAQEIELQALDIADDPREQVAAARAGQDAGRKRHQSGEEVCPQAAQQREGGAVREQPLSVAARGAGQAEQLDQRSEQDQRVQRRHEHRFGDQVAAGGEEDDPGDSGEESAQNRQQDVFALFEHRPGKQGTFGHAVTPFR